MVIFFNRDISGNRLFGIIPSGFCDMENLKDM